MALTACALQAPPTHQAIVRNALPPTTMVPPAWKAPSDGAPVRPGWLDALGDPTLIALVEEAWADNRDLAQAAERVRMAQERVVIAGAQLLPQVGAVLGGRTSRDEGHDGSYDSSVVYAGVAWEIDLWGRLRAQRAAAEADAAATALDYAYARLALAAMVARAWIVASAARQLLALSDDAVRIYGQQLALATLRRSAGKDTDLEVADTQTRLDTAGADAQIALMAYGQAQRALELLLGRYPASELQAPAAFGALPPPPGAGAPAAMLERRPDVAAAEQRVLAAFRGEEAARAALLPGVSVSLLAGRLGDALLSTLQLNPWLASAAIGVSIPIYEGGALVARVQIATALQAQAVAAYGATVLTAFGEVEGALANERLLARRAPLQENAATAAAEAVRLAQVQYVAGRRDLLWVSNLQALQLTIDAELIRLRAQRRLNRIGLYLALGGSAQADGPGTPGPAAAGAAIGDRKERPFTGAVAVAQQPAT